MNLKKIFAAAVLCATLSAGAFAADNYTLGIDIAGGIVGYGSTKFDGTLLGIKQEFTYKEVPFLPLKVNTYDCFLLNDHLESTAQLACFPTLRLILRAPRAEKMKILGLASLLNLW